MITVSKFATLLHPRETEQKTPLLATSTYHEPDQQIFKYPGIPFSMINAVIPFEPAFGSVFAYTICCNCVNWLRVNEICKDKTFHQHELFNLHAFKIKVEEKLLNLTWYYKMLLPQPACSFPHYMTRHRNIKT